MGGGLGTRYKVGGGLISTTAVAGFDALRAKQALPITTSKIFLFCKNLYVFFMKKWSDDCEPKKNWEKCFC